MHIPSEKKCNQLMKKMKMMSHIVAHSHQVYRVSTFLVDQLTPIGVSLNRELVRAAALLHDITKTRSFETKENHALTGAQFISDLGYPEVGFIVRQHVKLDHYFVSKHLSEAEIVNYADKRVLHDNIVSLKERMNYIATKYGKEKESREYIYFLWDKTVQLENRLFKYLSFTPAELSDLLSRRLTEEKGKGISLDN
jgi:putative nucleotidyltransferase with HDIG domain